MDGLQKDEKDDTYQDGCQLISGLEWWPSPMNNYGTLAKLT